MYASWTVKQLKDELRKRGGRVSGKKSELIQRLTMAGSPPSMVTSANKQQSTDQVKTLTLDDFEHDRRSEIERGLHLLSIFGSQPSTLRQPDVAQGHKNIAPTTSTQPSMQPEVGDHVHVGKVMTTQESFNTSVLQQDAPVFPTIEEHIISQGGTAEPELPICEAHLRGACPQRERCCLNHYRLPYLWQIHMFQYGWHSVPDHINVQLEKAFCMVEKDRCITQLLVNYPEGSSYNTPLAVSFTSMTAEFDHPPYSTIPRLTRVRRLSTPSYGMLIVQWQRKEHHADFAKPAGFHTQWRWYYSVNGLWKSFEDGLAPPQAVMESKYSAGQEVFMIDVECEGQVTCILINFKNLTMNNMNLQRVTTMLRRPVFVEQSDITTLSFTAWPPLASCPFYQFLPSNWYPVHTGAEFELVPINPEKMEFHLVAGEFTKNLAKCQIIDIFRLQNPFLWHKYHCKRMKMEQKFGGQVKEVQAFHGTESDTAVRSILHQNFDWRVAGKNATVYGHGCYFARDSNFSHQYTGSPDINKQRTMFLARVLVGKFCKGQKDYKRPPPLDYNKSFGDLYDSCVDSIENPKIYVIFDNDQCYPEYVINYKLLQPGTNN